MANKQQLVVQYNIPRYIIATPGKQNRACTGYMTISPGMTEVIEFQYGNTDGVPINLVGFTLRLVFWFNQTQYESLAFNMNSNIILAKDIIIEDPHAGICTTCLTDQETLTLGAAGRSTLRWSIFIINSDQQVFPTQITGDGKRYGTLRIDDSDLPISEFVKGLSVSPDIRAPLNAWANLHGVQATSNVGTISVA